MAYIIDGQLSEWTAADRLDRPGTGTAGYKLYAKVEAGTLVFAVQSDATAIGPGTTFWLNTDRNAATGHQIFGAGGGAEFNVTVAADGKPYLYTGADAETLVGGPLESALSADGRTLEFALPLAAVGDADGALDVLADVNNTAFLPNDYAVHTYTVQPAAALPPPPTDAGPRLAIVYSETSANAYFDKTAYSQLFMAAQNQAAMAGVPFDILTEADLADLSKLIGYDTIVFPSFQNVQAAQAGAITSALTSAVYNYGVGLVTAGNFMTNSETGAALAGDAYARMKQLLGVERLGGANGATFDVVAGDVAHPAMEGYAAGELIRAYTGVGTQFFGGLVPEATAVLARQVVGGVAHDAVLATTTGGRNVHFATEGMLADSNLLHDALGWAVLDAGEPVLRLQMSRQSAIFAARNDMDQSQEAPKVDPADGAAGIYDVLLPILERWKAAYDFVGSYYINVGNAPPDQTTDWTVSKPYYDRLLAMGNEIGSHSYTHPEDTNLLTADQLRFEFLQSKQVIEQQLGIAVLGAAIPGAPEKMAVSQQVMQHFSYLTGGNAMAGAGYPGAFGYMTPGDTGSVYLAPNISSDFTLVGWKALTAAQAEAAWLAEWREATAHADLPVVVFPWHDYGAAQTEPGYTAAMYEGLIRTAHEAGSEFVTLADLAGRIAAFEKAGLSYSASGGTVTATVGPAGLGAFALDLEGLTIASVANWYAYDADSVFLPEAGGTFAITTGAAQADVTHITALPSRARLLSATGDGRDLDFSVVGDGRVVIDLARVEGAAVKVAGAQVVSLAGERLELSVSGPGRHDVSVDIVPLPVVPPSSVVITAAKSTDAGMTVMGTSAPGGAVRVLNGDVLLGTATAAADGTWSVQTPPLGDAAHTITATATDAAGNVTGSVNTAVIGANLDDAFTGTAGNDVIDGRGGRDWLDLETEGYRGGTVAARTDGTVAVTRTGQTDVLHNVEDVRFLDGRLAFDPADPAAKVVRLYEAALDRLPDQSGLNFWIDAVRDGRPLSLLAEGFLTSPEFQARFGGDTANGAFVDQLYLNVLSRPGETEGRDFWVGSLDKGAARAEVLAAFSESAENKAGTAALVQNGIWDRDEGAAEVARLFDTVFGRRPDAGGLDYWKATMEAGTLTLAEVAGAFTGSAEFRSTYGDLNNRDFTNALYVNTLDRAADEAGLDFWTGALDTGAISRAQVVLAFSESSEHITLTAAVIQSEAPGEFGILFA